MAASPNLRIAIALQMVRNSIGGTRSASDRSDTVICFVPSVKSFGCTVEGVGSFGAIIEFNVLKNTQPLFIWCLQQLHSLGSAVSRYSAESNA